MKREKYLNHDSVRDFLDWLGPRVCGCCPFHHEYLTQHCYFQINSIWEAYEKYCWNGKNFDTSQELLDKFARKIRKACAEKDDDSFNRTAREILNWGGVAGNNAKRLGKFDGPNRSNLCAASELLKPAEADTTELGGIRYMNSGWTKVYAMMLDDFPIYDGRVGAAMGYLVRLYCTSAGVGEVPELLRFRWGKSRGRHNRNPSTGLLIFPQLGFDDAGPENWAKCNVWAAWIMGEMCRKGKFGELDPKLQLRALEAALFMIGYEFPTPKQKQKKSK